MISYTTGERFRLKASSRTILLFPGLNRYELWTLVQLADFLQCKGREICSKQRFFDSVTGNGKRWRTMQGYYYGLITKGFCGSYEYVNRPGSECVGISDKGRAVLKIYELELKKVIKLDNKHFPKSKGIRQGQYIPREFPLIAA